MSKKNNKKFLAHFSYERNISKNQKGKIMIVNSISAFQTSYVKNNSYKNTTTAPKLNEMKYDSVSFSGMSPQTLKSKYKVLAAYDIWAPNLKVKLPDTFLEKEALIEILNRRARLDKYTVLNNERFVLKTKILELNELMETNPSSPRIAVLKQELEKYGDWDAALEALEKDIAIEKRENSADIKYFKELGRLEDKFWDKKIIRNSDVEKYVARVEAENINPNGKYTTKELIKIIANHKISKKKPAST